MFMSRFGRDCESDQRRLILLVSNGCLSGASDATVTSQVNYELPLGDDLWFQFYGHEKRKKT